MTKPVVTLRNIKGSALDYTELDTNFANLRDATLSVTDGTNTHAFNLNDTVTFTGGTNITIGVNATTGAITISGTGGGAVNPGAAGALGYYPSSASTIDDTRLIYTYNSGAQQTTLDAGTDALILASSGLQLDAGGVLATPINVSVVHGGVNTAFTNIFSTTPGVPQITGTTGSNTYANSAQVDYEDFAGILVINNITNGNVALWLCGGGSALKLGDSLSNTSGNVTYQSAYNGYRWTNNTGISIQASFYAVETRSAG